MKRAKTHRLVLGTSHLLWWIAGVSLAWAGSAGKFDEVTLEQAGLEKKQLAEGQAHTLSSAMSEFRRTAAIVEYPSGNLTLPGYLYKPQGNGPFPAILWNHGSEKDPTAQPELARFYTACGFVFFLPIRHGHGKAPGEYIVDLQDRLREKENDSAVVNQKTVDLHDLYHRDVVAAVAWLRKQPYVDSQRMAMSGVSYGGIQTVLGAEKGLGMRAFVAFAPAAMSFANGALRARLEVAARGAKAPLFVLQAANDYSVGPTELLGPILKQHGSPSRAKLYPPFGTTKQQGHGAFACWSLGITIWADDVREFLQAAGSDNAGKEN